MNLEYANADKNNFFQELNVKVNEYFKSRNLSKKGNGKMFSKVIVLFSTFLIFYLAPYFFSTTPLVYFILQFFTGIFLILGGLNVAHDAMHNAFSKSRKVNYNLGLTFNLCGTDSYVWNMMHNIHHKYPNLHGFDNDISHQNIVRMSPYEKHFWFHKYQHIYVFFASLFTTLDYLFYKDYHNFFTKKIGHIEMPKHATKQYFILFGSKVLHFYVFLIQPILFGVQSLYVILIGFFVFHFVAGFLLYFIFTPAHLTLDADFDQPESDANLEYTWGEQQLFSTCNYGNGFLVDYLFGGLNNQIEHHLFPGICHIHYPELSKIVKETAEKYNLPYKQYASFGETMKENMKFLYKMGNDQRYFLSATD